MIRKNVYQTDDAQTYPYNGFNILPEEYDVQNIRFRILIERANFLAQIFRRT